MRSLSDADIVGYTMSRGSVQTDTLYEHEIAAVIFLLMLNNIWDQNRKSFPSESGYLFIYFLSSKLERLLGPFIKDKLQTQGPHTPRTVTDPIKSLAWLW